ncbi:hypothetical protein PUNSTDRAFT_106042, partial [Punctularia strigosozonata HHB-11173 SS5]|uniref:uncharacterized protein n=1 Tax=Punctularia strigosozonata (strain HHB-11173) TaxID=741275 RepID=UPI00044162B1
MSAPPPPASALITAAQHTYAAELFQLASFAFLVWDHPHSMSFSQVERIWQRPFTGATFLFLLNRYGTVLEISVVIAAFHSEWTVNVRLACYIVQSVYSHNICFRRVPLPPGFKGCILTGKDNKFSLFWVAPFVTDITVFILTMWQTRLYSSGTRQMPLMRQFIRDGMVYFLVIVAANLMNVIVYFTAVTDLKAMCATFAQLLTSVMISRLVLNLRGMRQNLNIDTAQELGHARGLSRISAYETSRAKLYTANDTIMNSWVATKMIGN